MDLLVTISTVEEERLSLSLEIPEDKLDEFERLVWHAVMDIEARLRGEGS